MATKNELCRCGSKRALADCCANYISGQMLPETPEQLMRSRYTAFALNNLDYIAKTMCGNACSDFNIAQATADNQMLKWLKLEVIHHELFDEENGTVEFKAYYRANGKKHCLHEVSEFCKVNGIWFYVNQVI